jgi:DNA-binding NarL/FixJ family response regulator
MMTMTLTRVIILADTTLHRAALEALLRQQPGIEVAGTAANVDDVASLLEPGHSLAILVDLLHISPTLLRQLAELVAQDRNIIRRSLRGNYNDRNHA